MSIETVKTRIKVRLARLRSQEAELAETNALLKQDFAELFDLEWRIISWAELENWLKVNRPDNDYQLNPRVAPLSKDTFHYTYCKLGSNGELQIGPYYHNDKFPRGGDLYIRHDLMSYREI